MSACLLTDARRALLHVFSLLLSERKLPGGVDDDDDSKGKTNQHLTDSYYPTQTQDRRLFPKTARAFFIVSTGATRNFPISEFETEDYHSVYYTILRV